MRIPRPTRIRRAIAARIRPSSVNELELKTVLKAYDLGTLEGYRQPTIGASRSRNLILQTSTGMKVLKRYKYSLDIEAIVYEHSVLRHLANADFPAPRLVLNRDGYAHTELNGKLYAVFDFNPGFKYSDFIISGRKKKRLIEEAARALAQYHQLVDGFVPDGKKIDGFRPDGRMRWHEFDWYLQEFDKYEALLKEQDSDATDLVRFFQHSIGRLRQDLFDLDQKLSRVPHLPKLVIHGDYGPYNLLFDHGKLTAVLDFECTHLDWQAGELIGAIHRFAGTKSGIAYDQASAFLATYQLRRKLTDDEISLMPDIFRFFQHRVVPIALRDYFATETSARLHHARLAVWWADWMKENGDRLIDALRNSSSTQFTAIRRGGQQCA